MSVVYLILLLFLDLVVVWAVGALGVLTRFRWPQCVTSTIYMMLSAVLLTLKAWVLFGVFFELFLIGALLVALGSGVVAVVLQIISGNMSADRNERANFMQGLQYQELNRGASGKVIFVVGLMMLGLMVWAYLHVRVDGEIDPARITEGMLIYFSLGSILGLISYSLLAFQIAIARHVGPIERNIFAISSIGSWGLQSWRAAFPFIFLPAPHQILGIAIDLTWMFVGIGLVYMCLVLVPLAIGSRLAQDERKRVWRMADSLLERAWVMGQVDGESPAYRRHKDDLKESINNVLIDIMDNDPIQRRFAFWRWSPDAAVTLEDSKWTLKPDWKDKQEEVNEANAEGRAYQYLSVIERPWFQHLMGPDNSFPTNKAQEMLMSMAVDRIPRWNYRARVFNELVDVLEAMHDADTRTWCGLARLSQASLSKELAPDEGRSLLTASLMTILAAVGSTGVTMFEGEIKEGVYEVAGDLGLTPPPLAERVD